MNIKTYLKGLKYWYLDRYYYRYEYRLREWFKRTIYKPVYFEYWSRDCDMCESSGVDVFYGSKKAYEAYLNNFYEGLEGPGSMNIIPKEEYEERKGLTYQRDRVMEAYENGNGTSIYV